MIVVIVVIESEGKSNEKIICLSYIHYDNRYVIDTSLCTK